MAPVKAVAIKLDKSIKPVEFSIPVSASKSDDMEQLRHEIGDMRRLLEQQMAGRALNEMRERHPEKITAFNALNHIGLEPSLARRLIAELPENPGGDRARFLPLGLLSRRISVSRHDPVMEGGVIALVGPTGVGKTTTLAKLAARYLKNHDPRDVALVSTDQYRIGAQEQLFTYGRLLGLPVHTAGTPELLAQTLNKLADRKLVLIDTAGMSQRDRKLAAQFNVLTALPVSTYLVMAANGQAGDLDEVVRKFGAAKPCGCILTKLDEATRIGGALSVLIRQQLPLAYSTDGQRVPEDIRAVRADQLVIHAMQLARQTPATIEDTTLTMRFTGASHAAV